MDFLSRITIYLGLSMGIVVFTMFSLMAIPHIIDQYQDIIKDYERSLEPWQGEEIIPDPRYYIESEGLDNGQNPCEIISGDFSIQNSTHILDSTVCEWSLFVIAVDWDSR